MARALVFGDVVNLRNGRAGIGYLCLWVPISKKKDSPESHFPGSWWVVTASDDSNAETAGSRWRIEAAQQNGLPAKADGDPVLVGDTIHLHSEKPGGDPSMADALPAGGYLDSCGWVSLEELLQGRDGANKGRVKCGVFTAASPTRDGGSGSWTIGKDGAKVGDPILDNDQLSLKNGYRRDGAAVPSDPAGTGGEAGSLVSYGSSLTTESYEFDGSGTYVFTSATSEVAGPERWALVLAGAAATAGTG